MSRTRDKDRTPFSSNRKRLEVIFKEEDFLKRFSTRWFNDEQDRVARAVRAGYEFVEPGEIVGGVGDDNVHDGNADLNSKVSTIVTGRREGNPEVRAYLMKIKMSWYKKDQKTKQDQLDQTTDTLRAGDAGGADIKNKYGDVRIS